MLNKPNEYSTGSYRPDIDGLRGIAILFVVLFHAFPTVITGGFIGVDIFFVISGFLISTIIYTQLNSNSFSFGQFYIRRIKRIFPALFLVLTFCFAFGWFNLLADEFKQLGKHIFGGAAFISNLVLWDESGYFDNSSETKPLLHLWSLGIEEQFYFIWPILLWVASRRAISFLWVGILVCIASFAANLYQVYFSDSLSSAFYLPFNRFWELMVGAILAYMTINKNKYLTDDSAPSKYLLSTFLHWSSFKSAMSIIGVALLAIGILLITKTSLFPGYWALLPVLGAALIIGSGQHAWVNRNILSRRILVWIGLISFPLYLWHWPLLSFMHLVGGGTPSVYKSIWILALSVLLSAATYYLIEKPIRSNKFSGIKAATLVFLLIIIGYIGLNTYQRDGLTFRLNQIRFRLPPVLQSLSTKDPASSGLEHVPAKIDCGSSKINDGAVENCLTPVELKMPLVFLWGDSYANHLLTGYEERYSEKYRFARKFYTGCPPIMDLELPNRKACTQANDKIFHEILNEHPVRVILAANWTDYDWRRIEVTINKLHAAGYRDIDLVGPAPVWSDGLYKQLYLRYLENKNSDIPYRMTYGLNKEKDFASIDKSMAEMANRLGVRYISITQILCNQDGCITRFGESGDQLESIDAGHFTKTTSRYVVSRFPQM